MGRTIVEKIVHSHLSPVSVGSPANANEIVDIVIDVRAARDFGGANVVQNIKKQKLKVADPTRTFFTFDCNPTGSDQQYAQNQQQCRVFARDNGIRVFDIDQGIGTHLVVDQHVVTPGSTFVSTDSHANIMGAICAFGQGMGDVDIAAAWARGSVWFKVPPSVRVVLKGTPSPLATAKDVGLAMVKHFGANGLLGYSAELVGEYIEGLNLAGRITISSLGTEMGAICILILPSAKKCLTYPDFNVASIAPDADAVYEKEVIIDIDGLEPMMAKPGNPEDGVTVRSLMGKKVDSCFIGSCTNGRLEDLRVAAEILRGRRVAPGVVLKIVPSTRYIWQQALEEGIIKIFTDAGALVGNSGCAGCAAGQIGQNGPGEVTISTGNRNFPGKQGKGEVFLASPATVAACAVSGHITTAAQIAETPSVFVPRTAAATTTSASACTCHAAAKPLQLTGHAWVIPKDNIDTDMIFHNKWLAITDLKEMGPHAFGNLPGWEDFPKRVQPGDFVVTGKNFGCGSSRQQAVDCFTALGVSAILGKSFGAIYERNAINAGLPILSCPQMDLTEGSEAHIATGDQVTVDLATGIVTNATRGKQVPCLGFNPVQLDIYKRGGLLMDW
ncbi:homoaconitate hydratase [Pelomyxa schiedti]|nr:homoaconitate hydratase [Pelomyxa schiedti]